MDGSSRPPVDVAIDQRLDDLQRTLLRLLARRRRHSWVDDPELKKVLATLYEHVCEARRLHSISDDGKREVADRALARLVDADETQLRELDAARAVADGFKQALVQFGTAEYCNVLLAAEDRQRTDDRGIATPSPERAVEELLLRYRRRANESRHREARRRIKARYLLLAAGVLAVLVGGFALAAREATDQHWWTLAAVALAGALGATLSGLIRLRDDINAIEDLRAFRPAMLVQPLVGAGFALVILMVLEAGFLSLELPSGDSRNPALAIFGFLAGFSEPFALKIVDRVARLSEDGGPSDSEDDGSTASPDAPGTGARPVPTT